ERRDIEVADLDDVDDETPAIADVAAGHVGADDAPVLLRGRLDRVHGFRAGNEIAAGGHVASRVDVLDVRAEVVVDDDPGIDPEPGVLEPVQVRPDPRRHDDDVAD